MRHSRPPLVLAETLLAVILFCAPAGATPVYLKLDSRFPSGHYRRAYLEGVTQKNQVQRWMRIETKDRAYGWLPEDHMVTSLKLAARANVIQDVPLRNDRDLSSSSGQTLKKGMNVSILENDGSWVRIGYPTEMKGIEDRAWIPSSALDADLSSPGLRAFLPDAALVYVTPNINSRIRMHVREPRFVRIVSERSGWIEVRYDAKTIGYIPKSDAVTLADLGASGARARASFTPLRSAPFPSADLVRSIAPRAPLTIISQRSLRWGQANLHETGPIWWPMNDDDANPRAPNPEDRLTTSEIFKRKVFDMATSPAVPTLRFVSADGVFRTNDTHEWTRISTFENKNFPLAIADGGSIFVGPYLSQDQGETFEQWIRWDRLVSILVGPSSRGSSHAAHGIRILDIKPQDNEGQHVLLRLTVGTSKPISVVTSDQGLSWRRLLR